MNDWSIKSIQNLVLEKEEWEKKNLYATDSEKCPAGIYYQLIGEKATSPEDPKGLRRMEIGNMIEAIQIKKLRSLGLLVEAQRRILDEEYNVSGRHDGIVISPTECTDRAKELIERKKAIYSALQSQDNVLKILLEDYRLGKITKEVFLSFQSESNKAKQDLYDEEYEINKELLVPDPKNSLIVMEIKSIVEFGFDWRAKEGKPMDGHRNQLMFYLWKLRNIYPWILGRVIYVDTSYQNLLEFNVDFDQSIIDNLKTFWKTINDCVKSKTPPPAAPSLVLNNKTGRWQINYQADWCRYHIHCTGDPQWKVKALAELEKLNPAKSTRTYSRKK